ncbi:MAG TPA: NifB/NifX family molybdenum-iron cluster-binding protein [Planctomycetota bacterium]|nr:NifB/NifX family molybdenum-iron cluster-binding protein [Planctomycetota bacterium]
MKIAVTSQGSGIESEVDARFGRARYFVVMDPETGAFRAVDNAQNLNASQGAGVQAARTVCEADVEAVVTGNVGPKAFRALVSAGVRVYTGATGTVAQAVAAFKAGTLEEAGGANVEGHWGGA